MRPEFVYVLLAPNSFARLWKFHHNVIMIKFMRYLCLGIVILNVTIFVQLLAEAYFLIVEQSEN